jgi:hypothetical protein
MRDNQSDRSAGGLAGGAVSVNSETGSGRPPCHSTVGLSGATQCPLLRSQLGVKRTCVSALHMSAFDAKRTTLERTIDLDSNAKQLPIVSETVPTIMMVWQHSLSSGASAYRLLLRSI